MIWPTLSFGKRMTRSGLSRASPGTASSNRQQPSHCKHLLMRGIQGRRPCRASFLRHFEILVEEVARSMVRGQPCSMHEKVVDFIGKNQLLKRDALLAERLGEIDRFRKWNIAIVVALNQENRRAPSADGSER